MVRPGLYNQPRRLSSSSNDSAISSTSASMASRESLESRVRLASWSSQTSVESFHSAQSVQQQQQQQLAQSPSPSPYATGAAAARTLAQYQWQRPAPLKQFRKKAKPGEIFAALPGEVLELILEELKKLHLAPGSASCATCWMRDACAMALSARKLLKFARAALYEDIQLVGADSPHQRKKYKPIASTRAVLLRKTLRSNAALAAIVHSLKVPASPPPGTSADDYENLVA